jgi:hypothetical protein
MPTYIHVRFPLFARYFVDNDEAHSPLMWGWPGDLPGTPRSEKKRVLEHGIVLAFAWHAYALYHVY